MTEKQIKLIENLEIDSGDCLVFDEGFDEEDNSKCYIKNRVICPLNDLCNEAWEKMGDDNYDPVKWGEAKEKIRKDVILSHKLKKVRKILKNG